MKRLKGIVVFLFLCFFSSVVIFYLNSDKSKIREHFGRDFHSVDFSVIFFKNRECKRQYRDFCFFKIKIESEMISDIANMPLPIGFSEWEEANEEFSYLIQIIKNFEGYIRSPEENNEIEKSHVDDFYALDKKESKVYYLFSFIRENRKLGYQIYIFNQPKKELTFFQCPWELKTDKEEQKELEELRNLSTIQ